MEDIWHTELNRTELWNQSINQYSVTLLYPFRLTVTYILYIYIYIGHPSYHNGLTEPDNAIIMCLLFTQPSSTYIVENVKILKTQMLLLT